MKLLKRLSAFVCGVREFRQSFTTSYDTDNLVIAYEMGRELAHKVTFRKFDECY
jgi:hypothetical protein